MTTTPTPTVIWFRRDLRLADHPALVAAVRAARDADAGVIGLFVIDPTLWDPAGAPRRAWLTSSLRALDESMDGALVIRRGTPETVVPDLVRETGAGSVHVTADTGPYGRRRDEAVEKALGDLDVRLVRTGTPYAIGPGSLTTGSGGGFKVFTPFSRTWVSHGWPDPAPRPRQIPWATDVSGEDWPDEQWPDTAGLDRENSEDSDDAQNAGLPKAGEAAARARWKAFLADDLDSYDELRDRPDVPGTTQLSAALKYGEIHPRTMLADLVEPLAASGGRATGAATLRTELAWREFYADVLWRMPETAREYYKPEYARMRYATPGTDFQAWQEGRTGYPFVDAGMRQLRAEGWMHNRVRMITASFLVKDLHVEWQHGAKHFLAWLRDGDLASNNHGWQWTAGSGTDASPYFRIFNPITQGLKFDPNGDYVRRYVPELRHLTGKAAHTPWDAADGYAHDYPRRLVDHAEERTEALERFEATKG